MGSKKKMKRDANISDEQQKEELKILLGDSKKDDHFYKSCHSFRSELVKLQDNCIDDMQYKILTIAIEKFDNIFMPEKSQ